jgi:hypothetical protein
VDCANQVCFVLCGVRNVIVVIEPIVTSFFRAALENTYKTYIERPTLPHRQGPPSSRPASFKAFDIRGVRNKRTGEGPASSSFIPTTELQQYLAGGTVEYASVELDDKGEWAKVTDGYPDEPLYVDALEYWKVSLLCFVYPWASCCFNFS